MPTSSQNSAPGGVGPYEPRYQVGDLIRNGLGDLEEIVEIGRARADDGCSTTWAIRVGFATYRTRSVLNGEECLTNTRHLHEMVDAGFREWAYLGPASEVARAGQSTQPQAVAS